MKAFEKIYAEYYDSVFYYVCTLCHDVHQAEEITQETFLKALKSIGNFRGECQLRVWLCQIAKNIFYTSAKRRQRDQVYLSENISEEKSLSAELVNKETAFRLHQILHLLDEPYKEVFWMRTFGELSFAEIGSLYGKSEGWARVTYHRAKIKIREEIQ